MSLVLTSTTSLIPLSPHSGIKPTSTLILQPNVLWSAFVTLVSWNAAYDCSRSPTQWMRPAKLLFKRRPSGELVIVVLPFWALAVTRYSPTRRFFHKPKVTSIIFPFSDLANLYLHAKVALRPTIAFVVSFTWTKLRLWPERKCVYFELEQFYLGVCNFLVPCLPRLWYVLWYSLVQTPCPKNALHEAKGYIASPIGLS